jgi:hypothetical protein
MSSNPLENTILHKSFSTEKLSAMGDGAVPPPPPPTTTTDTDSLNPHTPTPKQNTRAFLSSSGLATDQGMSYCASFVILGIVGAVFGLASLFLETYVVTANAAIVVFVVNPDLPRLQPARVRRRSNAEGHEHRRERSRFECCVHISSITWLQV